MYYCIHKNCMKPFLKIIGIAIGIKILYFVFAVSISSYVINLGLSYNSSSYVTTVKSNDSYWYEMISNNGYRKITDKKDIDRKSTRLNPSHANISYAVFCL